MKFYYKNPNKLKSDYREISQQDFDSQSEERRKIDFEWADKIVNVLEPHFKDAFDVPENLDENIVVEDKLSDRGTDYELSEKDEDKSVREKRIEKIAGLIGNLEKSDIDQIIKLLERKK